MTYDSNFLRCDHRPFFLQASEISLSQFPTSEPFMVTLIECVLFLWDPIWQTFHLDNIHEDVKELCKTHDEGGFFQYEPLTVERYPPGSGPIETHKPIEKPTIVFIGR